MYRAGVQTWCKVGVQIWVCRTGPGVQDWCAGLLSRVGVQGWCVQTCCEACAPAGPLRPLPVHPCWVWSRQT